MSLKADQQFHHNQQKEVTIIGSGQSFEHEMDVMFWLALFQKGGQASNGFSGREEENAREEQSQN